MRCLAQFNLVRCVATMGIAMGTTGMRFSLTSRDIIADSISAMGGLTDAFVLVVVIGEHAGYDCHSLAHGYSSDFCRYGSTIAPSNLNIKDIDLVSVFRRYR